MQWITETSSASQREPQQTVTYRPENDLIGIDLILSFRLNLDKCIVSNFLKMILV